MTIIILIIGIIALIWSISNYRQAKKYNKYIEDQKRKEQKEFLEDWKIYDKNRKQYWKEQKNIKNKKS